MEKKNLGLIITNRDLEILEFITEMYFASVENLYVKYFKSNATGKSNNPMSVTHRRLQNLEKAGYIKGLHSFSEQRKYYLVTLKGYNILKNRKPDFEELKPHQKIDHRTFDHDKFVLEARIALENRKAATSWVSDKRLRSYPALAGGLLNSNVPDAIYINEKGERVAFEYELTRKSNKDYLEKIKKYVAIMRAGAEQKAFEKVIYVCAKSWSYSFLSKETKIYGGIFQIIRLEDFLSTEN